MLDYKSIIIKRYALHMTYQELADEFNASKSGINDFIHAFEKCENLSYPLPEGITNYAIYKLVYGTSPDPIIGVPIMNSPILQGFISRWRSERT